MISGTTTLVAHLGYPTHTFKSSLICNPWFEKNGIDAVVVPMGIKAEDYPDFFRSVFTLTNIRGALITMPHKVTTMELVDEISATGAVLTVHAYSRRMWDSPLYRAMPFTQHVERDGVVL